MRTALIAIVLLAISGLGAFAQDQPRLTVELAETQTIVGQPLNVRIKILVPTWLPNPPDFPSLEVPGLMVRLPERASQPVSERVGADTWAGVQRTYRLYPLQVGRFEIPGLPVRVAYANPGSIDPVTEDLSLPPIRFDAIVPEAARDLSPLIIARNFTLDATVEGTEDLAVGGAVVRTLTALIEGTTPILIPQLSPADPIGPVRIYPDEPKVEETEDRGVLSGSRRERTTYLARAEGAAELPAVQIAWFNLTTNSVETAAVPAVPLSIAAGEAEAADLGDVPWRMVLTAAGLCVLLVLIGRAVWPWIVARSQDARQAWLSSEFYAHRRVLAAIREHDLSTLFAALNRWKAVHPMLPEAPLNKELATLGQDRFSERAKRSSADTWSVLRRNYAGLRKRTLHAERRGQHADDLNALNPDWRGSNPP